MSRPDDLANAITVLADWRTNNLYVEAVKDLRLTLTCIVVHICRAILNPRTCLFVLRELRKLDEGLLDFFYGCFILNTAYSYIYTNGPAKLDLLYTVILFQEGLIVEDSVLSGSSVFFLKKAMSLLNGIGVDGGNLNCRLRMEIAKAYLHKLLSCDDQTSDSLRCLSHVYLAALYHATGQYQSAINHCIAVITAGSHSQCNLHVVDRRLLPNTDAWVDIDRVLGLAVFHQYLETAALSQQQSPELPALPADIFAKYIQAQCVQSVFDSESTETTLQYNMNRKEHTFSNRLNTARLLLHRPSLPTSNVNPDSKPGHIPTPESAPHFSSLDFCDVLRLSAVEHFNAFRAYEVHDCGCLYGDLCTEPHEVLTFCCGQYNTCLQMCRRKLINLRKGDASMISSSDDDDEECRPYRLYPERLLLLNGDVVSACALAHLCFHSAGHKGKKYLSLTRNTLLVYLYAECQMELNHCDQSLVETMHLVRNVASRAECVDSQEHVDYFLLTFLYRRLFVTVLNS